KPDASYAAGEWDIQRASELAAMAGFQVTLDTKHEEFGQSPDMPRCEPTALYAGWYSLNQYHDGFQWTAGSIGLHIDSMSAWHPREGPNWVHNALARGITITAGAVSEPYISNYPHADGIFHDLLSGANAGDAFLRNTRLLKFRFLYAGDPLYRPFPRGRGALPSSAGPVPSMRVRSPRTLGGVPGVVAIRPDGDLNTSRTVKLRVHPENLGTVESPVVFAAGEAQREVQVQTAGVSEAATLRVVVESNAKYASGAIQLLPALARLEPARQEAPGGNPVDLRLQVGAVVHGAAAPVEASTNCARFLTVPARVLVPSGQDWVQFTLPSKPVTQETTCEVTLSKFGASITATVVLTPAVP
ncbi:MAG: TIGR03790 family protein, partial [Bryobacterales bacterium]|nr:TIGR03790 family protein [Bryobacterales bacterium]